MSVSCRVRNPEVLARGNSRTLRRKAASVASSLSDLPHGRLAGGMTYGGSPGTLLRMSVKVHGMAVLSRIKLMTDDLRRSRDKEFCSRRNSPMAIG